MTRLSVVLLSALLLASAGGARGGLVGAAAIQDGTPSGVAADPIEIGFSFASTENVIYVAMEEYLKQYAAEYGEETGRDISLTFNVADNDPSRQAANIEDLINSGVDLIMAVPADAEAIGASIRAAEEAGIPFITFDRESASVEPDAHVGIDSLDQAYTAGIALGELLQEQGVTGKCIEVEGDLRDVNAINRHDGWVKAEEEMAGTFETVTTIPAEWLPEKALTGVTNALQANPDANCLFVASDHYMTAVRSALENAGRWYPQGEEGHMYIASQDVFPEGLEMVAEGYIDVNTSFDVYPQAVKAIEVAVQLVDGEELEQTTFLVPGRVVTPQNYQSIDNLWGRDFADESGGETDEES